jgi:hypothetical protein
MSTEPTTTTPQAPPAWGDPQPADPKWSGKRTAVAAAVAIAIAAVGGVAIYAGTSANSSSQQGGMGGTGRMGGGFGGPMGGQAGGMTSLLTALHGDFTVSQDGNYVTERMQTGQVSALSTTSITVKSTDGYTQTYAIDSSTQKASTPASGASVTVIATVSGDTATATTITDAAQGGRGGMQGGPGGMAGGTAGRGGGMQGRAGMQGGGQGFAGRQTGS